MIGKTVSHCEILKPIGEQNWFQLSELGVIEAGAVRSR